MTVLDVIQRSTDFLAARGVESPRLQVELMLAQVLELPRLQLYLNFNRELAEPQLAALREMVKRRGLREPIQHILGSTSFCGLELTVNRHTLVPRPETEQLAELAWNHLNALAAAGNPAPAALDFGTGTGCLAIALAVNASTAQVTAIDVSVEALELARNNAVRHKVSERIHFLCSDAFSGLPRETAFDLIVTNPPYIPTAEIESLEPEVRDFDPRPALDGGTDGLDCFRLLAGEAGVFLKPDGVLMMEIGDGQAEPVSDLFRRQMWIVESVREDYSGQARFVTVREAG